MSQWSDEHIIAYLDGKLDMAQGQALHRDRRLDVELDAYITSLEIDTQQLGAQKPAMPNVEAPDFAFEKEKTKTKIWKQATIAASVLAVFGAGFLASNLLPAKKPKPFNWRQAVAAYHRLYTNETFQIDKKSDEQTAQEVAEIGRKLGVILSYTDLKLAGLQLRSSKLLDWKNKQLVQFVYTDGNNAPIAFCIIRHDTKNDNVIIKQITARKMIANQNAAIWDSGKLGFVVVGKTESSRILQFAKQLKSRMASL